MADSLQPFWLLVICFLSLPPVQCQDSYPLCFSDPPWSEIPTRNYARNGEDADTNGFHQITAVSDCRSYCRDTAQTSHFGIRRNAGGGTLYIRAKCYCGEVSDQTAVSADQCSLTCEVDLPCGGPQGDSGPMSAYRVPPFPYPLCFDVQLPWLENAGYSGAGSATAGYAHATAITQCRDHCRNEANTAYFAIRRNAVETYIYARVRCFCGDMTAQTQAPVSADQCSLICEGNFPCGGYYNDGPQTVYSACPVGKYGFSCDQDCLEDCRGGECYPDTGRCCPDGRYGDGCSITCANTNCQVNPCDWQTGYCRGGCAGDAWFGLICDNLCTSDNRHCTEDRCEQTQGDCINGCQSGWYGTKCDTACPTNCNNDECDAASADCSSCKNNDRFGAKCTASCTSGNRKCVNNKCQQDGGICINDCQSGYYGELCDTPCPTNCNNDVCDRMTGECDGCKDDLWFGQMCDDECSSETRHCRDNTCEQTDGDCINDCDPGYYGTQCNIPCPVNCKDMLCAQNSGECVSGCLDDKYHTSNCTELCPNSCEAQTCNWRTGECTIECPPNCEGKTCHQNNGTCTNGCTDDLYYGATCNTACPPTCKDGQCVSGLCSDGCDMGYYGDMCQLRCSQVCQWGCNADGCFQPCPDNCDSECDGITGECPRCGVGWYGVECNQSCPNNCQDNCDRNSGACYACRDGWYWHTCEKQCPFSCTTCDFTSAKCLTCITAFYGETCEQTCPDNCKNNICSRGDGSCDEVTAGTQPWVYAVTAVLTILVVALVVILVFCLRKRGRNKKEETPVDQSDSRELGQIENQPADDAADAEPQYEVIGEKPYESLQR